MILNSPLIIPPKPDEHDGWCDVCHVYSKRLKLVGIHELNVCMSAGPDVNACAACRYKVKIMTKRSALYFWKRIGGIYDPGYGDIYVRCPRCNKKLESVRGYTKADTRKYCKDVVIEHLTQYCNHCDI